MKIERKDGKLLVTVETKANVDDQRDLRQPFRNRFAGGSYTATLSETEDLTPAEKEGIETLEHKRWNAYMRAEGYIFSGSTDKSSRNDLGKMHHDLVDFASLTEEEKRKDSDIGAQ